MGLESKRQETKTLGGTDPIVHRTIGDGGSHDAAGQSTDATHLTARCRLRDDGKPYRLNHDDWLNDLER